MTVAPDSTSMLGVAERAPIYAWLSRFLVCEVGPSDWESLRSGSIRSVLVRLEPALERELEEPLSDAAEERLAEEFARLFLLPGGVSPFASSWAEPANRGGWESEDGAGDGAKAPATRPVRETVLGWVAYGLQALGREPVSQPPWGRLPLDHFGVLLDLVSQAAFASEGTVDDALAPRLEREVLDPYLTAFGDQLGREARLPLYRALGRLLRELGNSGSFSRLPPG